MNITCHDTRSITTKRIFPKDLNIYQTLFGGDLLQQFDLNSSIAVSRFCHQKAFTVSVDHLDFKHPVFEDHALTVISFVSGCGSRSIETFNQAFGEDLATGDVYLAAQCFMTYALHRDEQPLFPHLVPETDFEKQLVADYDKRQVLNQQWRQMMPKETL